MMLHDPDLKQKLDLLMDECNTKPDIRKQWHQYIDKLIEEGLNNERGEAISSKD